METVVIEKCWQWSDYNKDQQELGKQVFTFSITDKVNTCAITVMGIHSFFFLPCPHTMDGMRVFLICSGRVVFRENVMKPQSVTIKKYRKLNN